MVAKPKSIKHEMRAQPSSNAKNKHKLYLLACEQINISFVRCSPKRMSCWWMVFNEIQRRRASLNADLATTFEPKKKEYTRAIHFKI